MDIGKWLDKIFAEYQKTRRAENPPWYLDPNFRSVAQDAFLTLTSVVTDATDINALLENPWMSRLYSFAVLGADNAKPSDFIEQRGRLSYVTQNGAVVDFQMLTYMPQETVTQARLALFGRLFGRGPSPQEEQKLVGLDLVDRFELMQGGTPPGVPETVLAVNRIINGGALTSQAQARTLYNTWLSKRSEEGYDTTELAKDETFAETWRAYEGNYAARNLSLGTTFNDFLAQSVTPSLPTPERFNLGGFMKNQAQEYRQLARLLPSQPLPESVMFLLERGFPVANALYEFTPRAGETYLSYQARLARSATLGKLVDVLNKEPQQNLDTLGVTKPTEGFTPEDVEGTARAAGLIESPYTFQDAQFRGARGFVTAISPPAMGFEEHISTNLGEVLASYGRPTSDMRQAILSYARTLPADQQMSALQELLSSENEIQAQFLLQLPTLQTQYQEQQRQAQGGQAELESRLSTGLVAANEEERKRRESIFAAETPGGETVVGGDEQARAEAEQQRIRFETEQRSRLQQGLITQGQYDFEAANFQPRSLAQLTREAAARGTVAISREAAQPLQPMAVFLKSFDFGNFLQAQRDAALQESIARSNIVFERRRERQLALGAIEEQKRTAALAPFTRQAGQ